MKNKIIPLSKNIYTVSNTSKKIIIFLNETLLHNYLENEAVTQLIQASKLNNVIEPIIGMPDIHTGFGLPIGGVLATDYNKGVVSAGAVGYDINCGVRLLSTKLNYNNFPTEKLKEISNKLTKMIPLGIGKNSFDLKIHKADIEILAYKGISYYIENGYGRIDDLLKIENKGCIKVNKIPYLSKTALNRLNQLGTLGSGNHFIEIGKIEKVFDTNISNHFGLYHNNLYVMIHSGSRGFGYQIADDFSKIMWDNKIYNNSPADTKGLANAPIESNVGQEYLNAMAIAANYAFVNRQIMAHFVRESFSNVLKINDTDIGLDTVYDVAHNIAKKEKHNGKYLLIHRKGATRALPPNHIDNPEIYIKTGQPAIIPGSMGTYSYVVVGTDKISQTYNTVNHGAGRVMSRKKAKKEFNVNDLLNQTKDIILTHTCSINNIIDEAPNVYKDIDEVVFTLIDIGFTKPIVKLKPLAVLKGD